MEDVGGDGSAGFVGEPGRNLLVGVLTSMSIRPVTTAGIVSLGFERVRLVFADAWVPLARSFVLGGVGALLPLLSPS